MLWEFLVRCILVIVMKFRWGFLIWCLRVLVIMIWIWLVNLVICGFGVFMIFFCYWCFEWINYFCILFLLMYVVVSVNVGVWGYFIVVLFWWWLMWLKWLGLGGWEGFGLIVFISRELLWNFWYLGFSMIGWRWFLVVMFRLLIVWCWWLLLVLLVGYGCV